MPTAPVLDPVLNFPRPDVEALVWRTIRSIGGVEQWVFTSNEMDLRGWLTVVSIQVDVRAGRKGQAFRNADQVRRAVCALPWVEWADGVVCRVDVTEGPLWLPDDDGAPRYVVRFAVTVHPPRPAGWKD